MLTNKEVAMKASEFKRWLAKQGATFEPGRGSHLKVYFNGPCTPLNSRPALLKPSRNSLASSEIPHV